MPAEDASAKHRKPDQGQPTPEARDRETLKEIARRIRSGLTSAGSVHGGATGPADPAGDRLGGASPTDVLAPHPVTSERAQSERAQREADGEGDRGPGWTDLKLAKLAHELRTPLAAVVALAEIMRDERLGPMGSARYRSYAADIFDSAQHALSLIQSVVEDARDGPDAREQPVPYDVNRVIAAAMAAIEPFADRAGVTIAAAIAPGLPTPALLSRRLTQVLLNVLTNALNHTPHAGRIAISAQTRAGDRWLLIDVSDSGRGMTADEITSVMSRPVSAARPGSSLSGSTGFGVPLVRDFVHGAGGTFTIASEPGRGTEVSLALPPLLS